MQAKACSQTGWLCLHTREADANLCAVYCYKRPMGFGIQRIHQLIHRKFRIRAQIDIYVMIHNQSFPASLLRRRQRKYAWLPQCLPYLAKRTLERTSELGRAATCLICHVLSDQVGIPTNACSAEYQDLLHRLELNSTALSDHFQQVGFDTLNHSIPIAHCRLAVKGGSWIPRAVATLQKPTPAGVITIQNPYRLADCAG